MSKSTTKCSECALHVVLDDKCGCLFCLQAPKDYWEQREKNANNWHNQICKEGREILCEYFQESATRD